ncbi:MAG: alpha/beta hydrolase, partial [Planctomycetes bacterium]|nr:alpha/beta hydrolase [Planctomycetota bacterium]
QMLLNTCEIGEREALVFIHGYNVTFKEAAIRAAQIGFDLKIPGLTAFFSWPSKGGVEDYPGDTATIGASEDYITQFLIDIADVPEVERVHIIAHSMGNRALLQAMKDITYRAAAATKKRFGQIIMAAPDVDADKFKTVVQAHQQLAERTTLYASTRDKALWLSGNIYDFTRAGFSPPITIVDGLDTVEVLGSD